MQRSLKHHSSKLHDFVFGRVPYSFEDLPEGFGAQIPEIEKQNAVVKILKILANAGSSTHRIENIGAMLCSAIGITDVSVALLPSLMTVTFDGDSSVKNTRSITVRLSQGLSLNKLEIVDAMVSDIIYGRLPPSFFMAVVAEAEHVPSLFPLWIQVICAAVCCGFCAVGFFGTQWDAALIVFCIALFVMGPLSVLAAKFPSFEFIFPPTMGFFAGLICRSMVVVGLLPRGCLRGAELSTIITLAPGISLSLASLELASKSIVSGTSRLVAALAVAFLIGVGLSFGEEVSGFYDISYNATAVIPKCTPLSYWWLFLTFPVVSITFFILLDCPFRRWVVCLLSSAVAYFCALGLSFTTLSSGVQNTIASLAVGLFGTIYSRLTINPSVTPIFSGIMFLVPGALSISTFQTSFQGSGSANFGIEFLLVAVSIAIGILVASVPRFRRADSKRDNVFVGANSLL